MNEAFKFELGGIAAIVVTGGREAGMVIGRAQYLCGTLLYLLRYEANDGRAVEQWWSEEALREVTAEDVTKKPSRKNAPR
jgi:hypothetical protein